MTQTEYDEQSNAADAVNKKKKQESFDRFIESNAIARAKEHIPKCETCKHFKIESTLTNTGYCNYIFYLLYFESYCSFHEPKPQDQ